VSEPLSDEEQQARRNAIRDLMVRTPFLESLGLVIDRWEPDDVTLRIPWREDLTNDGLHYNGGVTATLLDTAASAAAWSNHDFDRGTRAATVSMSLQYVWSPRQSDLVCHARTVRRARELVFTEMTVTDADGKVAAHGVVTYRIA
jgi:uncharacterized protein (TIGR00369 family)